MIVILSLSFASRLIAGFGTGWPTLSPYVGGNGCLVTDVYSHWSSGDGYGTVTFSHTILYNPPNYNGSGGEAYSHTYDNYADWYVDASTEGDVQNTCINSGIIYTLYLPCAVIW